MAVPRSIGAKIRAARTQAGLRQADLGELVDVETENISRFENGRLRPSSQTVEAIAGALGISVAKLYSDEPVVPKSPTLRPVDRRLLRLARNLDEHQAEILVRSVENLLRLGGQMPVGRAKKRK